MNDLYEGLKKPADPAPTRRRFLAGAAVVSAATILSARCAVAQESFPRKLGFAIVGIGRLSINQLFPAFAHCKYAKLTALVSGDADKAKQYAAKYGVDEKHIYSYA